MIGLQRKIELFKRVKEIILNNLLYNGRAYENKKKGTSEYVGPIYFDSKGRDIYSSPNPYLQTNQALKQLGEDLSRGTALSE